VAGSGTSGHDEGAGATATFSQPAAVVADAAGNLYVADAANNCIRKLTFAAGAATVSTYAGDVAGSPGSTDATDPLQARFNFPSGLAIDAAGNLYVADSTNNRIRKVAANGGAVTTVAGSDTNGPADGNGTAAQFANPTGLALAGTNLYVADKDNHAIRKIDVSGTTYPVTTYAGGGGAGLVSGTGTAAKFFFPSALAADGQTLYVVDSLNHRIRKIDAQAAVTTFAGLAEGSAGTAKGFSDGPLDTAKFDFTPGGGLAVAADHTIYVADPNNDRIRAISGTTIRTVAGVVDAATGRGGFAEGAATTAAKFSSPIALTVLADGTIYVADQGNNRIRKLK
jgi:sugar lactone lactonase YvrE